MTWTAAPHQKLTVECPVKHCGESLNVTWYKLLDSDEFEVMNHSENVEIAQESKPNEDKLISRLTFKRIAILDDGMYKCELRGYEDEVSHMINISVSDSYQGIQNVHTHADAVPNVAYVEDLSWMPYFYLSLSIAPLAAILTVLTILRLYCWKRILTINQKKNQEISTHTIPDPPKGSAPSISVLPANFEVLHENYSPPAPASALQLPPMTCGNQSSVAHTADKSLGSDHAVYAAVSRRQPEKPARELQNHATHKNTEYATIKFPSSS
ncbi:B- and T-lymphocyte attenuator-like isoform X2 [Notolabrus celidotus]|nr:B- and T-lymphocyte attenuator-like isoform X2 [Notolabrus celidotus]